MSARWVVVVFALALLPAGAGAAPPWAASFGAAAAGSYVPEGRPAILVAAAGSEGEAGAAAEALRSALRRSGRVRLAMDASAIGDVETLPDNEIVRRAVAQPVQVIAIVRVFPGAGHAESAVVTLYDRDGRTLNALTVERGQPLGALSRGGPQAVGEGVSREATSAVSDVLHGRERGEAPALPPQPERTPAERSYDERFVGFFENPYTNRRDWDPNSDWGGPYLGVMRRPLKPEAFYEAVERPEYAAWYRHRDAARTGLVVSGAILVTVGTITALAGGLVGVAHPFCQEQDPYGECILADRSPNAIALGVGLGALGAGITFLVVGARLAHLPVDMPGNHRLAAAHNRRLRKTLGLPPADDPAVPHEAAPGARISITPRVASRSAGLGVQVEF
jgi:hypothetical protein